MSKRKINISPDGKDFMIAEQKQRIEELEKRRVELLGLMNNKLHENRKKISDCEKAISQVNDMFNALLVHFAKQNNNEVVVPKDYVNELDKYRMLPMETTEKEYIFKIEGKDEKEKQVQRDKD